MMFNLRTRQDGKFPSVSIHVRTGDDKDYLPARMVSLPQVLGIEHNDQAEQLDV